MNNFLDTLNALIAANGLNPDTVTLSDLMRMFGSEGVGEEFDSRGFSVVKNRGMVRIRGIEKLRQQLKDAGRDDLAALVPTWHITDYWNTGPSSSLEGINNLGLPAADAALLNRNMNKWFFLPGGVNGTSPIPTNWDWYIRGLQSPWGGSWTGYDYGQRAPFSPAEDVTARQVPGTDRVEYALNRQVLPDVYLWPMSVNCADSSHHTNYWRAWASAVSGLDFPQ